MCIRIVSLSIRPKDVLELLMGEVDGDLIHHEYHEIKDGKGFGYAVFEKFYTRPKHEKMIIVNTENIDELTTATVILSSNYEEWPFELEWETEDECLEEIMEILDEHIIDERKG